MIIDFHTHVFPDKIAERTIDILSSKSGFAACYNGSISGLVGEMERGCVDVAVTLPVLTNPAQFESVLRFALSINESFKDKEKRLISFAGMHPKCDDIDGKMRLIKESGFLGVKIHPDYQDTFIDDEGYIKILQNAKELDLIVVTHSGVDAGYRDMPVRCTPERVKKVIRKVEHPKFVLAHFGANEMPNEVFDLLCGENGFSVNRGDAYTLACAVLFAAQILAVDHFVTRVDGVLLSCLQFTTSGILNGITALIFEPALTWQMLAATWLPLCYTGILSSGVAYTLQILGQKRTQPAVASLLMSLESVFAVLAGAVILTQWPTLREAIGCVVMFAAVILAQVPTKER